jgi:hypothetical protein
VVGVTARWIVVETATRQGSRWHIRFVTGGGPGETVVHREGLESRDAAHRAILSVARAHSRVREAWIEVAIPRVVVGGVMGRDGDGIASIPIVYLTEQPKRSRWSRRA